MIKGKSFEVIIIGGSYSGLSAAMALGRSLRSVLIIDNGTPCNIQTPYSHNFLTQDGKTPTEISTLARKQVERYDTVKFHIGIALQGTKIENGFEIKTQAGEIFNSKKLIFATGLKDVMPEIKGFTECWGLSVIHCPYCHGYEARHQQTGIFANGNAAMHYVPLVRNLTKELNLFTNGISTLTFEQTKKLEKHNIQIVETEIDRFEHNNGQINSIIFKDGTKAHLKTIYASVPFQQQSIMPESLGYELTDTGHIKIDIFQRATIQGIYACGDNSSMLRSIANAVSSGNFTGAFVNKELCEEE